GREPRAPAPGDHRLDRGGRDAGGAAARGRRGRPARRRGRERPAEGLLRAARRAGRLRRPAPRPGHRRLLRLGGRRPRGGRRRLNAAPPDSAYLPRTDEGRAGHDLLVAGPPFALPAVVLRPPPGCGAGAHSPGSGGMASGFSSSHFSTASASWPSSNWLTTMSSSEPNCSSVIFAWEI